MKYAVIIVIAFIALSCSNEKINNDWTKDNLQGKVMSFSEFSYTAENRFGIIKKGKRKRQYSWLRDFQKKYDKRGNQIKENSYDTDGNLDSKWTYKYDNGNVIEINIYNADGNIDSRITYKYDDKGNQIEENNYKSDGSLDSKWSYKYEFDKQGNWIKRIDSINQIPKYILEREYEYYD